MTTKSKDVVLLCNPRAGGRWRALADVLDSPEAKLARRIVTDEIDDIQRAIADVGQRIKLLCVYGGDGTIQRVIDDLLRPNGDPVETRHLPQLAILGGGTMNVTARWCGMRDEPGDNFRAVMRAYQADRLLYREVPLLAVTLGGKTRYGFTFGAGPHRSDAIAAVLDSRPESLAPRRSLLIAKGMIWSPAHGETAFTVPMFDEFLLRV